MLQHVHAIYENGVLKPLEPLHLDEHQRVCVSVTVDASSSAPTISHGESFFEAATRLGVIGSIVGTPPDLSTNKRHMEGFGKPDA